MKRTYTRRNMTTKPEEGDSPPEVGQKRRKNNIQSEFKPINTLTGNIPGTVTRRQFSGPISCQYGDSDFEIVDERPSRSVLQHHMVGKVAGSGIPTSTIHGQGFRNFRACVVKSGNHGSPRSRAPAPSCPKGHIDNSMVIQSILDDKKEVKDYDDNKISADPVSKPDCTIMRQEAQKATKKPYIPKTNELVKSRQSKKDLWGRRIHPSSPQAYLWNLNQTNSPLLRLPAELRNYIFELVLGFKTIVIDFNPYRVDDLGIVQRTLKYTCTAYQGRINPFQERSPFHPNIIPTDLTLLNGVCRQLYYETEILPYKLNLWAFEKHLKMTNFLFVGNQLKRKHRAAIQELLVTDQLPGDNMLKSMSGLRNVFLTGSATATASAKHGRYGVVKENGNHVLHQYL